MVQSHVLVNLFGVIVRQSEETSKLNQQLKGKASLFSEQTYNKNEIQLSIIAFIVKARNKIKLTQRSWRIAAQFETAAM